MTNREKFLQDFGRRPPITTYCPYEDCPDASRFKHCLQCMNDFWVSTYIPQTTGHWIFDPYTNTRLIYTCSECGGLSDSASNYCQHCGLPMKQ